MRNQKFRLSDMIPNAWFYKLRDMSKTKKKTSLSQSKQPLYNYQTWESPKSCCNIQAQPTSFRPVSNDIDDIFPHLPLPRRPSSSSSSQRKSTRKTIYKPSPRRRIIATSFDQSCSSETSDDIDGDFLIYKSPSIVEFEYSDRPEFLKGSSPCSSGFSCSDADIIIDVKERSFVKSSSDKLDAFDTIPVLDLPPIFTKQHKKVNHVPVPDEKDTNFSMISPQLLEIEILDHSSLPIKKHKEEKSGTSQKKGMMMNKTSPSKRPAGGGIKLRTNSPRICSTKKTQGPVCRRSVSGNQKRLNCNNNKEGLILSESFAVVKASVDPEKDFMESMMEMILENNIRGSKDLEHLLACYLTLNSNQYHQLIVKAFEQIWFNVPHLHS